MPDAAPVQPLIHELLALPRCTGCAAIGPEWCDACARILPDVRWHRIDATFALCTAFQYAGPIQRTIIDWKEHQHRAARLRVERWFAAGLRPLLAEFDDVVCVPIPSSPRNDRLRGAAVLHDAVATVGVPVSHALVSARTRRDQAGLTREERESNLRDAFTWRGSGPRSALLVDDVVTSGATMRAAAAAIRDAGGTVRAAFGLARRGRLATVQAAARGLP